MLLSCTSTVGLCKTPSEACAPAELMHGALIGVSSAMVMHEIMIMCMIMIMLMRDQPPT